MRHPDFDGQPYNMLIQFRPRWWCRYCGAEFERSYKSRICNCGRSGHMLGDDQFEFINASLDELNSADLVKFFRRMWFRWFPAATIADLKRRRDNVVAIHGGRVDD